MPDPSREGGPNTLHQPQAGARLPRTKRNNNTSAVKFYVFFGPHEKAVSGLFKFKFFPNLGVPGTASLEPKKFLEEKEISENGKTGENGASEGYPSKIGLNNPNPRI